MDQPAIDNQIPVTPRMGVGVIGAGGISGHHLSGLARSRAGARAIAIADPDENRLRAMCDRHFVPLTFTDHRRLLDRADLDLVTIATPPSTHERLVVESLEAGKAVLCEKPLAQNPAAADRILAAAERYPGNLCVIHQRRYERAFRRLRWLCEQGWLGKLEAANFERACRLSLGRLGAGWWGRWDVAGGGMVITQCIHELDLMIQLLGRPVEVEATMATQRQPIESEDTFEATVRFRDGATLSCGGTLNADASATTFRITGRSGAATLDGDVTLTDTGREEAMQRALEEAFPQPKSPGWSLPARAWRKGLRLIGCMSPPALPPPNSHGQLFDDYITALRERRPPPVPPEQGREAVELCTAIYTAALTGRAVRLPLDRKTDYYGGITADDYRGCIAAAA